MEQNMPVLAKKLLKIVKVVYFMLRKGISKGKLLADLATFMKRGKIAGKAAMHNLMFHHHHHQQQQQRDDYEFSCSNSPAYRIFQLKKRKHSPPSEEELMAAALKIVDSASASPALPGFGPSPLMVRKLRVTDSPFPIRDGVEEDNHVIDDAAEEFIMRFYQDLRQQNSMARLGYY